MRAFSLLEILITLIIFTAGIVFLMQAFNIGLAGSVDAENTAIASELAQRRLEEIKNLDFETEIVDEEKAPVTGFIGFQREVVVTEPEIDLKQVIVNVYWAYKAGEVSTSLVTYISNN